jgi:hypothetical protein
MLQICSLTYDTINLIVIIILIVIVIYLHIPSIQRYGNT